MWYLWLHEVRLKNWSHNARCAQDIPPLVWIAPARAQRFRMCFRLLMFVSCVFAAEVLICTEKMHLPQTEFLIAVTQRSKETTRRRCFQHQCASTPRPANRLHAFSASRTTTTSFSEQGVAIPWRCARESSLILSVLLIHPLAVTFPLDTY